MALMGTIYFIQYGLGGPIKIGFTSDLLRRITKMQTDVPQRLLLLGSMVGDRYKERELHIRFEACRLRGEWFNCHPEILEYIRQRAIQTFDAPPVVADKVDSDGSMLTIAIPIDEMPRVLAAVEESGMRKSAWARRLIMLAVDEDELKTKNGVSNETV